MLNVLKYDPCFHESVRIGCYDARWFEWFKPHRDDATPRDAYRKYTLTINLNTGEYAGGELRFPEYSKAFQPPTGTALVFRSSAIHEVQPLQRGRRFILMTRFMDEADYHNWVSRRNQEAPGPDPLHA
jgi:predicted 2-oxoglutarate/Fe(II)-dependent dioxygenase YbiX